MDGIKGQKYKLAGISVYTKGTLVDVFAAFARLDEDIEEIMSDKPAPKKPKASGKKPEPGTVAAMLENLTPLPRSATIPYLSAQDIVDAIVGKRDLRQGDFAKLELNDESGVIADLGREKLAQVLLEMGRVRDQVLSEGQRTFVPIKPKAAG